MRVELDDNSLQFENGGTSPAYRLEPDGLEFEQSVALEVSVDQDAVEQTLSDGMMI